MKKVLPNYIKKLILNYPQINSGRKNFNEYNLRLIKTLKIIKEYYKKSNN